MKRYFHFLCLSCGILSLSFVTPSHFIYAQGLNGDATIVLDFQTTAEDTQTSSQIETTPVFQDVNGVRQFTVTLVLQNARNLVGFNTDLVFDPTVLNVVSIHEERGDLNFDGRSNIADVLTLGERLGASTATNGYSYFNLAVTDNSASVIDQLDVNALLPLLSPHKLFWTSNPDTNLDTIRESVEIFEDPQISNGNGLIDDIVVVLLPREHPNGGFPTGFGFTGDARIAEITFAVVNPQATTTQISFVDRMALDESTQITATEIVNASVPQAPAITITLQ